jgi:uncharacterized membrane protein YphA (DoxX/SURF4 family)
VIDRLRAWNASLDEAVDTRAIALLRLGVAPLVVIHLWPFFGEPSTPHVLLPYASWYPVPSPGLHRVILWAIVAAAVATSLGLVTRIAAWATVAGVAYNLFLSETYFHHNRAFLLILLIGVAILPTGGRLSVDRLLGTPRRWSIGGGRRLALTVLRMEVALVYLASGTSKLLDPDWWGGTVTLIRVQRYAADLASRGLPGWVLRLLSSAEFHRWAAKGIILTELFIGLGLLWRRSRLAAVWTAILFHLAIELTASVQVFSLAGVCALVIWVTPSSRDRVLHLGGTGSRMAARLVAALDWTGRFVIERTDDPGWTVIERDGAVRTRGAKWFVASRLPIAFPVAALALPWLPRPAYPGAVGAPDSDMEVLP